MSLPSALRVQIRTAIDKRKREEISAQAYRHDDPRLPATLEVIAALAHITAAVASDPKLTPHQRKQAAESWEIQREVWVDRFILGRTLEAIGKSQDPPISRERVRQLESAADRKIRPLLARLLFKEES